MLKGEKIKLILKKISLDNLKHKANIIIPYKYIFLIIIFINISNGSTLGECQWNARSSKIKIKGYKGLFGMIGWF